MNNDNILKSPQITSLRIFKLSAYNVYIKWDSVGSNFYYNVDITQTRDEDNNIIPEDEIKWRNLGYTSNNEWFESTLYPNKYYKMRVQTMTRGLSPSSYVYTEEFLTFEQNAYNFEHMNNLIISNDFINKKFVNNLDGYFDFNRDMIYASLMKEDFQFNKSMSNLSNFKDKIINDKEFHEIQGEIQKVCSDENRTMLAETEDVLYLYERFQPIVKASNDKGQTWQAYKAIPNRVGNPVSRICTYQSSSTTYVLGYEYVFYGRKTSDIRWSSDQERFSSDTITFAKLGDTVQLGYDVEIYANYARLPADVTKYAEAMACTDEDLFVAAKNTIRHISLKNAEIDRDPDSPTFNEKIFDPEIIKITDNDKIVVFKMDVVKDQLLVLVTGEVKKQGQDPTDKRNVIPSKDAGVYLFDETTRKFTRVFGVNDKELDLIEHGFTSLSTDGEDAFISVSKDKLPILNGEFDQSILYYSDKNYHMASIRAKGTDLTVWKRDYLRYYAEAFFCWMKKSKTRSWINNENKAVVVYPERIFTYQIDNIVSGENRTNREVDELDKTTVYLKNIYFNGFNKYSNGIVIHKYDGTIFAYIEFDYRVRGEVSHIWKPKEVALVATLVNQERKEEDNSKKIPRERDPNLVPLLNKMIPDSYLLGNENFEKFTEYYLKFISDDKNSYYKKLLNLIRNKYPREENAYEYLWSEINKRNIYLDKAKRDQVVRFFESRATDFYSTKGTEQSYKFLFKLLYNEDVEIDIESKYGLEYDIVVESDNISDDIVGRTIYTPTGRSNVTYIERVYVKGNLQWRMTIHNLLGRYIEGQVIKSESTEFQGKIVTGVRGKEHGNNELYERSRSAYVMRIKSNLPTSRYYNDVIRFVHPVGFGFIGITLISMFINAGLNLAHTETIINKLKNFRWDSGLPLEYYDRVAILDNNGNIARDGVTGEPMYNDSPNKGVEYPLPADYDTVEKPLDGVPASKRRKIFSPLLDQSAITYSNYRMLMDKRLKDNIGNPRDPHEPTQEKLEKEKSNG